MSDKLDKWENAFCPVEYLPLIIPLWEKYKLHFYDLSIHMDDAKRYILYFSLEGSEDDIRLYTSEFHGNREYYLSKIKEMVCSAPETPDAVGDIEKTDALFEFYSNPPKRQAAGKSRSTSIFQNMCKKHRNFKMSRLPAVRW